MENIERAVNGFRCINWPFHVWLGHTQKKSIYGPFNIFHALKIPRTMAAIRKNVFFVPATLKMGFNPKRQ